jgi:hypothetical protein
MAQDWKLALLDGGRSSLGGVFALALEFPLFHWMITVLWATSSAQA